MKRTSSCLWVGGAVSAFWAFGAPMAFAQDGGGVAELDQIVVTATKRAANPQDLGVAITAFSSEELREKRIDTVADLVVSVPNVELYEPTGGGVPIVVIRGVGLQDFRVNNTPTASFYVDEVYQPSVATTNEGMFDLERIEILKGPQGGLYGRNTTGGAVQLVSARPQFGTFGGALTAGAGSYGERSLDGAVNVPVSETLALRASGHGVWSDGGYTYNALTGREHGAQERWALRLSARWEPTDALSVYANVHGGADRSETPLLRTMGVWTPGATIAPGLADSVILNYGGIAPGLGAICAPILAGRRDNDQCANVSGATPQSLGLGNDPYASLSSSANRLDSDWIGAVVIANLEVGEATITSVTGVDRLNYARITDWDGLPAAYQDLTYRSEIEAFSQELRIAWSQGAIDWIAGLNYAKDTLAEDSLLLAEQGLVPVGYGVTKVGQIYKQETTSFAGFVRGDLRLGQRTKLVGELRYTNELKTFSGGTLFPEFALQLFNVDQRRRFDDYSGRLEIDFRQTPDLLWYASLSRGFKSGGFFGGFATAPDELAPYEPEIVTAYEAGVKSEWLSGTLRANASVFYYDYAGLQGFANTTTTGGAQISLLSNVGDAEISGAEFEFAWRPMAALTLQMTLGLLDGEIVRSDRAIPDSFASGGLWPLQGQRLLNQSDRTGALSARYEFDVTPQMKATLQAGYAFRSDFNFDFVLTPQEAPLYHEGGYGLANFRAAIGAPDGTWELSAWLDNAFDEQYRVTAKSDDLGGFYELYGAPRTWGAALSFKW